LYEITGVIQGKISAYLFRYGRNVGKIADDLNKYPGRHAQKWTVGDRISGPLKRFQNEGGFLQEILIRAPRCGGKRTSAISFVTCLAPSILYYLDVSLYFQ